MLDFNFYGKFDSGKPICYYTMEFIEIGEFYNVLEETDLIDENMIF